MAETTAGHFGADGRLFGVATHPAVGRGRDVAVVVPNSPGIEYLALYAAMIRLQEILHGRGFSVLRFDFRGTGDSAGDLSDVGLSEWREDLREAVSHARTIFTTERVSVAGARIAASIAAQESGATRIDSAALWDPLVRGATFLRDARARYAAWLDGLGASARAARREIFGYALGSTLWSDIENLTLDAPPARCPTLLLTDERGRAELSSASTPQMECVEIPRGSWLGGEERGEQGLLVMRALRRITSWLDRRYPLM